MARPIARVNARPVARPVVHRFDLSDPIGCCILRRDFVLLTIVGTVRLVSSFQKIDLDPFKLRLRSFLLIFSVRRA